jgi:hypothetical protein
MNRPEFGSSLLNFKVNWLINISCKKIWIKEILFWLLGKVNFRSPFLYTVSL